MDEPTTAPPLPPTRKLPRNVIALGVVSFLNDASSEMIYPLLPIFLRETLGASIGFVGVVEGIAESTSSVLKLFSGQLADRLHRRKPLVFWGYTLAGLTRPLIALALLPWHVLALRFVDRVGKGVRTSPRDALIADSTPAARRGYAFGFHRSMDHFGAVVGPLLAAGLLRFCHERYRVIFGLAAIPALLSLLVVHFAVSEVWSDDDAGSHAQPFRFSLAPFPYNFRLFLAVVAVFTLGNSSDAFLLLRAKGLGVAVYQLPILWVVLHIVKTLSSTPCSAASDRIGRRRIIIAGWLLYALVYCGMAAARLTWHAWALFAVYGIFFGLTEGAEKALVADFVPAGDRGSAFGLYHFIIGIMMLPASLLFGLLWQWRGAAAAFATGAALAGIAAILLGCFVREPFTLRETLSS